jgi:hypothetical protein
MTKDWRKLFTGQSVRAVNQDTGEVVNIPPYVLDSARVTGAIVRFRYRRSGNRTTEHHLLCWRCWTSAETVYLSGLCARAGFLRQYVVDNIFDVVDLHSDTPINNPKLHFLSLAEISAEDIQLKRLFDAQRAEMKKSCLLGLKVLTYISFQNQLSAQHELEVMESYLRSRLGSAGTVGSRLIEDLMLNTRRLKPNSRAANAAIAKIAEDEPHLDAVWIHSEILLNSGAMIPKNKLARVKELIAGVANPLNPPA